VRQIGPPPPPTCASCSDAAAASCTILAEASSHSSAMNSSSLYLVVFTLRASVPRCLYFFKPLLFSSWRMVCTGTARELV